MKYLNTITLRTQIESNDDNIISTDDRVKNWYTKCPDGFKGEWIGDTYTFVEIPPPLPLTAEEQLEIDKQAHKANWLLQRQQEAEAIEHQEYLADNHSEPIPT